MTVLGCFHYIDIYIYIYIACTQQLKLLIRFKVLQTFTITKYIYIYRSQVAKTSKLLGFQSLGSWWLRFLSFGRQSELFCALIRPINMCILCSRMIVLRCFDYIAGIYQIIKITN